MLFMKIGLFSSKKSEIEIIPLISKLLSSQISGVKVIESISDNNMDLIREVSFAKNFDLKVVILFYSEDGSDVKVLIEKLVELELNKNHSLKFIEKGVEFEEKEEANKIVDEILLKLFGKRKKTTNNEKYESYTTL